MAMDYGPDDELFTTSPAAREAGIAACTLIQLANAGKIPVTRTVSGTRLFRRRDIEILRQERQARREAQG